MRELTVADFNDRIGQDFSADVEDGQLPLTLDGVQELPSMGRQGGAFRLEFLGPHQPILPQAIYPLHIAEERMEIFIVPIGQEPGGVRYEAIFV